MVTATREGAVSLSAGAHDITITFFENGGGAMLKVAIKPPGAPDWAPLAPDMLSNHYGCSCHSGLFFEAYDPQTGFDWGNLEQVSATVTQDMWVGTDGIPWQPTVRHEEHAGNPMGAIWYENDGAFVQEIDGFDATDNFVMRWRGVITVPVDGHYNFATESDDGSLLYIDGQRIVDNDGIHGVSSHATCHYL